MRSSGGIDVKWIAPQRSAYALPPMRDPDGARRRERTNALIVTVLSLGCTGLAIFDLFLFALHA
jgi:hypothetical protein